MDHYEGFDKHSGQRWIYPNNMSVRGYQKQAVEKALFTNAMIVLPTGFGKTFIAAVVMYNFYRWYPQGKIIFVAPTRPLVTQQIQECKKISGIPPTDCVELTGHIGSQKRIALWETKRVFFATPQVIENDLKSSILPAKSVKCLVIDEAHKAQGGYAYVGIVKQLHEVNRNGFRILALSATPGSDIQRVQQIMLNLYIGDVMFRSEQSIDLLQYRNSKVSKAWTVELGPKHKQLVEHYIKITEKIFKDLAHSGVIFTDNIARVTRGVVFSAMQRLRLNGAGKNGKLIHMLSCALSLSYNFELLVVYGIRPFYSSVQRALEDKKGAFKTAVIGKVEFNRMMDSIKDMFGDDVQLEPEKSAKVDLLQGHPKLQVVKDLLMKHFEEHEDKGETRAIVFTGLRESVLDLVQTLRFYDPVLKVAAFIGQGKSNKTGIGMKQKEQIQVVNDFKSGKYNVLVATCVAEEGLDIGEVDLIICYDTTASPISNVQRRGRTGRKRSGDVQTLLTRGYEEGKLRKAGDSKRQVEDQLFKKENYMSHRYRDAPRMVPPDVNPICLEQKIFPVAEEEPVEAPKRKRTKKQTAAQEICDEDCDDSDLKKKRSKKGGKKIDDYLEQRKVDSTQPSFSSASDLLASQQECLSNRQDPDTEIEDDQHEDDEDEVTILEETSMMNSSNFSEEDDHQVVEQQQQQVSSTVEETPDKVNKSDDSDIEWGSDIDYYCV